MHCTALHAQYSYLLSIVSKIDLFIQPAVCWKLHSCPLHPALSCFPTKVSAAPLPTHWFLQLGSTSAAIPVTTTPLLAVKWWILIKLSQGILQSLKVTFVLLHLLPSLNKYFKLDDSSRRFYSDTSSTHFPALLNHKALDPFPGIRSKISPGYIDHSTNCIMKAALHQSSSKSLLSLDFAWLLLQSILEQFKSLMINPQGFFKVLFL